MAHYDLKTEELKEMAPKLRAGDTVSLTGTVYTARDAAHKKIVAAMDAGEKLPFDLDGAAIYYAGPTPAKPGQVIGSVGPTTSGRMDPFAPRLLDAGLSCMIQDGGGITLPGRYGNGIQDFIDEALDLVAFAKGDPSSSDENEAKWAQARVNMGHPEPFEMNYIGIGNEQWGDQYFERYELFADAILAVYPDIKLLFSAGPNCEGEYYEQAMQILSEGGVVPEYIRVIIQKYFEAIQ